MNLHWNYAAWFIIVLIMAGGWCAFVSERERRRMAEHHEFRARQAAARRLEALRKAEKRVAWLEQKERTGR